MTRLQRILAKRGVKHYSTDSLCRALTNPAGSEDFGYLKEALRSGHPAAKVLRQAGYDIARRRERRALWQERGGFLP